MSPLYYPYAGILILVHLNVIGSVNIELFYLLEIWNGN